MQLEYMYYVKYAIVAYGNNKLVTAAPPIDPVVTVKFVPVMS